LHMALPAGQPLFPEKLMQAGYYCVQAGKWHLGDFAKSGFNKVWDMEGGGPGGEERWIECLQNRPKDKPFFLWLASTDAHRPWKPDKSLPQHQPDDAIIPPYLIDTPAGRVDMALYYDEIQRLDHYVGKVVEELKRQDELENTCIIFMADNGRPFPRCKTRLYDSGIKTPLIFHWPDGIQYKDKMSRSLVSAIDIAPTILEFAGLKSAKEIQGISMVPILKEPDTKIRQYVFAEHNWHVQIAHERMVRWQDYVYIRNAHPQLPQVCTLEDQCPSKELREFYAQGKTTAAQADPLIAPRPAEELYILNDDPYQLLNQVNNPDHQAALNKLRRVMDEWQQRTGDSVPSLADATPDRHNRETGERYYSGSRPPTGELPGESREATLINDPGPR
jgi:N-sulfoglucosamine sulfohydrolase